MHIDGNKLLSLDTQKIVVIELSAQNVGIQSNVALALLKLSSAATDLRQDFKNAANLDNPSKSDNKDETENALIFHHLFRNKQTLCLCTSN